MRRQHDQLQEEYSQQEQQGSLSLLGIDKNLDKNAYDIQQNFINKTKEAADLLATKGVIDSGRRRQLSELKSMYAQQVVPLQNALTQRSQRAGEYRKLGMDKNNILGVNPNNIALTDIVGNPKSLDYKFLSGTQMAKDVANEAKQFADRFDNKDIKDYGAKVGFNHLLAIRQGVDPTTVLAAMKNDPKVMGTEGGKKVYDQLVGIVNSVTDRYGLKDIATTPEEYNRGWQIASSGLSEAIGKVTPMQMHDDKDAYNFEHPKVSENYDPLDNTGRQVITSEGRIVNDLYSGLTPNFDKSGNVIDYTVKDSKQMETSYNNPYGGLSKNRNQVLGESTSNIKELNQKQSSIKQLISEYRETKPELTGKKTDEQVWTGMKADLEGVKMASQKMNHTFTSVKDPDVSNAVINDIFVTNSPGAKVFRYGKDYSNDTETGYDLGKFAKELGATPVELAAWLKKTGQKTSLINESSAYGYWFPKKFTKDKQGDLVPASDDIVEVGVASNPGQSNSIQAIEKIKKAKWSSEKKEVVLNPGENAVYDRNSGA